MEGFLNLTAGYLGGGIPLHKPFPYSLYHGEDSSILGTNEKFGDPCEGGMTSVIETIGTTSRILGQQVQSNRQKRRLSNGGCLEIKDFFFRWQNWWKYDQLFCNLSWICLSLRWLFTDFTMV